MPAGGVGYWTNQYWHVNYWDDQWWTAIGSPPFVIPFMFLAMPARRTSFVMPPLGVPAVAETLQKNPQEIIDIAFSMVNNVPQGATITSGEVYASRKPNTDPAIANLSTTFSSTANADASTISLVANPGIGAYLLLHPLASNEELVIATNVTGIGPFTVTIDPLLAYQHLSGGQVTYEPGVSSQILTSTVATVTAGVLSFRVQRGVSARGYRLFLFGNLDTGAILRGELDLDVVET